MMASELRFEHLGQKVRWTIEDPTVLIEEQSPWGELEWMQFGPGEVNLGVTFLTEIEDDWRGDTVEVDGVCLGVIFWEGSFRPDTVLEVEPAVVPA